MISEADAAATFCATLIDEWVRRGAQIAIVSPGSRSTPMAIAAAADDRLRTEVLLDERGAAFAAVGAAAASGTAAILICTSGTAAAEYHAAVVEAHQAARPMVVVTADRPPELQGVWAPQTIDQKNLFGSAVRWFIEPGPPVWEYRSGWRHLAADAWDRAHLGIPGPVHLNLGFREPLIGTPQELPAPLDDRPEPVTGYHALLAEQFASLSGQLSGRRGLIIAGDRSGTDAESGAAILALADALGWPVLADPLSGLRVDHPSVVTHADPIARADLDGLRPEIVLRVGGLHASRVLGEWLAGAPQLGWDRFGIVPDPGKLLLRADRVDVAATSRDLAAAVTAVEPSWRKAWAGAERAAREACASLGVAQGGPTDNAVAAGDDDRESLPIEVAAVRTALATPGAEVVVISSSMPIRDAEWFGGIASCSSGGSSANAGGGSPRCVSNRGANGIDGVVSTAIGSALTGAPTVGLIGDLAFLHDQSALTGLARRDVSLRLVVIDNDGGGIFSFLPQATQLSTDRFEQLYGTPHGTDLVGLCAAHGLAVRQVASLADVVDTLGEPMAPGVEVIVVASDRASNRAAHAALIDRMVSAIRDRAEV